MSWFAKQRKCVLVFFLLYVLIPSANGQSTLDRECLLTTQGKHQVEKYIELSARKYGLDPHLLWAKAKVESNLRPCLVSAAGAMGVMQLMPETAIDLGVTDPFDVQQNVDAGARYLLSMINRFQEPQLYLAAYNAGPNAVLRKRYVPNYSETRRHIRKVLREYMKRSGIVDDYAAVQALKHYQEPKEKP